MGGRICLLSLVSIVRVIVWAVCLRDIDVRTLRRLRGILIRERDFELEQAAFPDGLLFARYAAVPLLEVHHAVCAAHGFREEAEGVVASPLSPATR